MPLKHIADETCVYIDHFYEKVPAGLWYYRDLGMFDVIVVNCVGCMADKFSNQRLMIEQRFENPILRRGDYIERQHYVNR